MFSPQLNHFVEITVLKLSTDLHDSTLKKCSLVRDSELLFTFSITDTLEGIMDRTDSLKIVTGKGKGNTLKYTST